MEGDIRMIEKMGKEEIIADLAKRSGLSKADVTRVLKAQMEAAVDNLAEGKGYDVPGVCGLTPEVTTKLEIRATKGTNINVKAKAFGALVDRVRESVDMTNYKVKQEDRRKIKATSLSYMS